MTTRHITLSTQQGMVTELELTGFGAGENYVLRCHRTSSASANGLDESIPGVTLWPWSGFRYRNNEISVLMPLEGGSFTEE
jgi:hypothetical protein